MHELVTRPAGIGSCDAPRDNMFEDRRIKTNNRFQILCMPNLDWEIRVSLLSILQYTVYVCMHHVLVHSALTIAAEARTSSSTR